MQEALHSAGKQRASSMLLIFSNIVAILTAGEARCALPGERSDACETRHARSRARSRLRARKGRVRKWVVFDAPANTRRLL
jgi:hypothetical protein